MDHQQYISELLARTANAYEASEIKSRNLFYSVCATPIYQDSTLVLGFNWGASEGHSYEAQSKMETKPFTQLDLGSLKRTLKYFYKYLPNENMDEFVQSNFCFFRSKNESDICPSDLDLTQELFESFLEYTRPKKIVSFSMSLRGYLENRKRVASLDVKSIRSGTKVFSSAKALLAINSETVPIYFLPHPNYPITNEARNTAWEHCFGKSKL